MVNNRQEQLYTKAELNKAFSMGLERAVVVLEESIQLSRADRWHLIESLKEKIIEDKIAAAMSNSSNMFKRGRQND